MTLDPDAAATRASAPSHRAPDRRTRPRADRLGWLSWAAGPAVPAPQPDPPPLPGVKALLPLQVWVVDDDPVVALYLGELLHEHGFAVTTFADPRQALHACEADPRSVDVVVTDQRMPELSGDLLARALLRLRPQMRVILCTGYSDLIDEQRALAIGVQHFFRKPFDAQALLRAVRGSEPH